MLITQVQKELHQLRTHAETKGMSTIFLLYLYKRTARSGKDLAVEFTVAAKPPPPPHPVKKEQKTRMLKPIFDSVLASAGRPKS
jgi:hypothetical protein